MKENNRIKLLKAIVMSGLILAVIYPIVTMLMQIKLKDIGEIFLDTEIRVAISHSICVTVVATLISLSIGYILAYVVTLINIRFRKSLTLIFTMPMLLPSISHGLGLINLFGSNGLFSKAFDFDLYGFNGIVMGSIIYTLPVAFLMLSNGMRYVDMNQYEVVDVLGIPKYKQDILVIWPYMKKPFIVTFFTIAIMIFTDYGVPLAVGGRYTTLATYLYTEVIGLLDFSKGAIIGCILIIPAILNFLVDISIKDVKSTSIESKRYSRRTYKLKAYLFTGMSIVVALSNLILIGSFVYIALVERYPQDLSFSLKHLETVIDKGALKYLMNSIEISGMVAIIGTVLSYIVAYMTTRLKPSFMTKIIHMISMGTIAIPGMVLGLSYIMSFKKSSIYGTISILVIVNIVHFFATTYLMARNAMEKLNIQMEEIAQTLKISRINLIKDVFIPNTFDTILEMMMYFFISSMTTISAVTFLYGIKTMPISIMVNQFIGSLMFEEAAIISILILLVNILLRLTVNAIISSIRRAR